MKYLFIILIGVFLLNGCIQGTGTAQPINSYSNYTPQQYGLPTRVYYAQPTTYRIKPYHPMNSGMGF